MLFIIVTVSYITPVELGRTCLCTVCVMCLMRSWSQVCICAPSRECVFTWLCVLGVHFVVCEGSKVGAHWLEFWRVKVRVKHYPETDSLYNSLTLLTRWNSSAS